MPDERCMPDACLMPEACLVPDAWCLPDACIIHERRNQNTFQVAPYLCTRPPTCKNKPKNDLQIYKYDFVSFHHGLLSSHSWLPGMVRHKNHLQKWLDQAGRALIWVQSRGCGNDPLLFSNKKTRQTHIRAPLQTIPTD